MDRNGEVSIRFSEPILVNTTDLGDTILPNKTDFEITIRNIEDQTSPEFTWEIRNISKSSLDFDISFREPLEVSVVSLDEITVEIKEK